MTETTLITKEENEIIPVKKEENEIIPVKKKETDLKDVDMLNPSISFNAKLKLATDIADSLKDVIEKQGLFKNISGKEYVIVEGWQVLGTMLGCSIITEKVEEQTLKGNGYLYKASVRVESNGNILTRAEAICTSRENISTRSGVYSMAQTRATSKAYRLALGWIMKLAGYSPTPKEEMDAEEDEINAKKNKNGKKSKPIPKN